MANENYTDTTVNNLVINKMTQAQYDALSQKLDTELYLVPDNYDTVPTNNSDNPITSGGVYIALEAKQDVINNSNKLNADYIVDGTTNKVINTIESIEVNGVALNPDANKAVNVQVPTNTNQLTNGAGYITSAQVPSNYPLQTQTALTVQIAPNTFNVWENAISNDLTITLGTEVSGVMNEYLMQFSIATGSTPQVTFPSNLQWIGIDTFQGGKTYQVSIVNGYAIGVEFDTITQSNS